MRKPPVCRHIYVKFFVNFIAFWMVCFQFTKDTKWFLIADVSVFKRRDWQTSEKKNSSSTSCCGYKKIMDRKCERGLVTIFAKNTNSYENLRCLLFEKNHYKIRVAVLTTSKLFFFVWKKKKNSFSTRLSCLLFLLIFFSSSRVETKLNIP